MGWCGGDGGASWDFSVQIEQRDLNHRLGSTTE